MNYDLGYSFYRDKQIDIALEENGSSYSAFAYSRMMLSIRLPIPFDVSYGLKDNLTMNFSLPLIYKMDTAGGKEAVGLGDVVCWFALAANTS
jgi:hypothetical protein